MDQTLKKICALLQSADPMRRCAAAIALAELAPRDAAIVKALGEALEGAEARLTGYVLEAFEAIGSSDAVPYVMPLLDAEDVQVKLRAVSILAKAGGAVVGEIKSRLEHAKPAQKFVLVDALARVHTREAFRVLLDVLLDHDFEVVKGACEAIHRHVRDVPPKDRAALHKEIVSFMNGPRVKSQERVVTSCLLLLGYIGRPEARAILLKYSAPSQSLYLRRHALIGLRNLDFSGAAATAVARRMFEFFDDPDEGVVRHALDIIGRLPASGAAQAQWPKFLGSKQPAVRAFAARRVGEVDSAANNRALLGLLRHEDTELREIAASALAAHVGAVPLLLGALTDETEAEAAWRLAKILKPHGESMDKKAFQRLRALAQRELQAGKPRYEPLLYVVRNVDAKAADTVLAEAGMAHRSAGQWSQAVECLRRIIHTESFDDEARYALSVSNLKLSPKDLSAQMRAEDHALRGFQTLLRSREFKLFDRLKKDKALDAADMHYVGFHFSEATAEDKDFGEQLLAHVAKTWPRSDEGKAAKAKLKLK